MIGSDGRAITSPVTNYAGTTTETLLCVYRVDGSEFSDFLGAWMSDEVEKAADAHRSDPTVERVEILTRRVDEWKPSAPPVVIPCPGCDRPISVPVNPTDPDPASPNHWTKPRFWCVGCGGGASRVKAKTTEGVAS